MPYKTRYSFEEYWTALTAGTLYKSYAKANPGESGKLEELAGKKMRMEAYFLPIDIAKTKTGTFIAMMIASLPA